VNAFEQGLTRYLDADWLHFARNIRIGFIGAGGLGSNCAMHLARSGFSNLILVDPDRIEASNLNRQAFFLRQLGIPKVEALRDNILAVNPSAQIETHILSVDENNIMGLFGSCQAVIEAVDQAGTKKMIAESMAPAGCLVVSASGMGGSGRTEAMRVHALGTNLVVVGDMATPCDENTPPLSPGVGVAAAMQADIVLQHFLNQHQASRT